MDTIVGADLPVLGRAHLELTGVDPSDQGREAIRAEVFGHDQPYRLTVGRRCPVEFVEGRRRLEGGITVVPVRGRGERVEDLSGAVRGGDGNLECARHQALPAVVS